MAMMTAYLESPYRSEFAVSMAHPEVFSGIKVLVALARADRTIHPLERLAIENALDGAQLPTGVTIKGLLASDVDLGRELARIKSREARRRTFAAARALVYADGELSVAEAAMLARIARGLCLEGQHEEATARDARSFRERSSVMAPSRVTRIDDAAARERAARDQIANAAVASAVLATASLPIPAESCLFESHVRLARDIGLMFGYEVDDTFWRTFTQNVIGDAGSRLAIKSILELIPSSSRSASAAYASTYALGQVAYLYFAPGAAMSTAAIRDTFLEARKVGRGAAVGAGMAIAARRARLQGPKAVLDVRLEEGALTEMAYANELLTLA